MDNVSAEGAMSTKGGMVAGGTSRQAGLLSFICLGVYWGFFSSKIPRIAADVSLSYGEVGTYITILQAVGLPFILFLGRRDLLARVPLLRTIIVAVAAMAAISLATFPLNRITLIGLLVVYGIGTSCLDLLANRLALTYESRTGEAAVSLGHAAFAASVIVGSCLAWVTGLSMGQLVVMLFLLLLTLYASIRVVSAPMAVPSVGGKRPATATAVSRSLLIGLALIAFGVLCESGFESIGGLYSQSTGHSSTFAELFPALMAGCLVFSRLASHLLSKREWHDALFLIWLPLMSCIALIAACVVPALGVWGLMLCALAMGAFVPACFSLLSREVQDVPQARVQSLASSSSYLGLLLGPMAGGLSLDHGPRAFTSIFLVVMVCVCVLGAALLRHSSSRDK